MTLPSEASPVPADERAALKVTTLGPQRETGERLGAGLLAYMLGVTLIITLLPFQFDWPSRWRVMLTGGPVDIVANVLLFLPLGFLFRLSRRNARRHSALHVLGIGALLSMAIEAVQLFEAERYTSVLDVGTNAFGAWAGAMTYDRLAKRLRVDGAMISRFSLELPLMGLVYLLVPLLWLNAVSAGDAVERALLAMLLGAFGATVLGGIQRHHFGPLGTVAARVVGMGAAVWFLTGAFPVLARRPVLAIAVAAGVGLMTWWQGSRALATPPQNRRFEVPVLLSAAPAYAAYLVLLTTLPLLDQVGPWSAGLSLPGVAAEWTKIEILRFLELVAAFTLLGYVVAEFRGRFAEPARAVVMRLVAWGVGSAVAGEAVRGFHHGHGASAARALFVVGATLYGGWLYHLQRAHVVRLLDDARDEGAS